MRYSGQSAQALKTAGYRQTSRRHGTVARCPLSAELLRAFFMVRNFGRVDRGVPSAGLEAMQDHYRRCHANGNDVIEGVPDAVLRILSGASGPSRIFASKPVRVTTVCQKLHDGEVCEKEAEAIAEAMTLAGHLEEPLLLFFDEIEKQYRITQDKSGMMTKLPHMKRLARVTIGR